MFFRLTNAIKKIIIHEIQDILKDHPEFSDVLIINKYQDQEREKVNIIIKSAAANSQRLSLDDFGATVQSYTTVANMKGVRGDMLEWVKDDLLNINELVPPGFFVMKMISGKQFIIEQYLVIDKEKISIKYANSLGQKVAVLNHTDINPESEVVSDYLANRLVRGQHYTIDNATGEITFLVDYDKYYELTCTYQYIKPDLGPFDANPYEANNTALPGVVLAFGDKIRKGDVQVVVVSAEREDSAKAGMGRWNMTIDLDVRAQDTDTAEKLIDYVGVYLWSRRIPLADRGVTITDFSLSGESEEQEMEVPDEYNFSNVLSLTIVVEWELHIPLLGRVEKIFIKPPIDTGVFTDEELVRLEKQESQYVDPKTFGTVDDPREGRYYNYDSGSKHFVGVNLIQSINSTVVRPSIIL
jgi:hypothetical protein